MEFRRGEIGTGQKTPRSNLMSSFGATGALLNENSVNRVEKVPYTP